MCTEKRINPRNIKILVSFVAVVMFAFTPFTDASAKCWDFMRPCPFLKGIGGIFIKAEASPEARIIGLSEDALRNMAVVALRSRLPRIQVDPKPNNYILHISLNMVKSRWGSEIIGFATNVSVELYGRGVLDGVSTLALYWGGDTLGYYGIHKARQAIGEGLENHITSFASKWYEANPGK